MVTTNNKLLQEPISGSLNWDSPLNTNFLNIDQAFGAPYTVYVGTGSSSAPTVSLTSGTTFQTVNGNSLYWYDAQQLVIQSGSLAGGTQTLLNNVTVYLPNTLGTGTMGGAWIIRNAISSAQQGSYTVTIVGGGGSGASITVSNGTSAYIYTDGTNVYYADSNLTTTLTNPSFTNVTITGTESVAGATTIAGVTTIGLPVAETVTITIASPAVITAASVPVVNTPVVFSTTGALPTGITAGTTYYVLAPTATTFNIAATIGGTAINTSGTQSGTQTATFSSQFSDALNISSSSKLALNLPNIAETATISATAATGTINYDLLTQSVLYYTTAATANWTVNTRGNSLTTLNSIMGIGQSLTFAFLVQNQNLSAVTTTITIATPAVFTITGTLPVNGTPVTFSSTGALPTGLTAGATYYVINASGSTFNVSATVGGSAIATSGTQSGTQTVTYYGLFNNAFQIDGSAVTPKWQGGTTPTYGNNGAIDVYTYTIIKTAASTYTVLASLTPFK